MERKLIILKDLKSLNLVKGDVLDYNASIKTYVLDKKETNEEIGADVKSYSSFMSHTELNEGTAAKLIDDNYAELEFIYPEKSTFERRLSSKSTQELELILDELTNLRNKVQNILIP